MKQKAEGPRKKATPTDRGSFLPCCMQCGSCSFRAKPKAKAAVPRMRDGKQGFAIRLCSEAGTHFRINSVARRAQQRHSIYETRCTRLAFCRALGYLDAREWLSQTLQLCSTQRRPMVMRIARSLGQPSDRAPVDHRILYLALVGAPASNARQTHTPFRSMTHCDACKLSMAEDNGVARALAWA